MTTASHFHLSKTSLPRLRPGCPAEPSTRTPHKAPERVRQSPEKLGELPAGPQEADTQQGSRALPTRVSLLTVCPPPRPLPHPRTRREKTGDLSLPSQRPLGSWGQCREESSSTPAILQPCLVQMSLATSARVRKPLQLETRRASHEVRPETPAAQGPAAVAPPP